MGLDADRSMGWSGINRDRVILVFFYALMTGPTTPFVETSMGLELVFQVSLMTRSSGDST
jgi:hypothetical protein